MWRSHVKDHPGGGLIMCLDWDGESMKLHVWIHFTEWQIHTTHMWITGKSWIKFYGLNQCQFPSFNIALQLCELLMLRVKTAFHFLIFFLQFPVSLWLIQNNSFFKKIRKGVETSFKMWDFGTVGKSANGMSASYIKVLGLVLAPQLPIQLAANHLPPARQQWWCKS